MKKSLIFLTICTLVIFTASSQEISIASTNSYTSCEGAVVDSGLSAADYGANENQTITWCPEAPETVLNLYWVVFDLDAASTIYIYDGDDNTAPLVGTYSGDELQGQDIFSGEENVTGCMTIEFTSGPGSSGNFGAYASCGYPCDRPFAIVNPTELQPHYACLNEEVHLEATSSTVADGQEIVEWVWDLGDGTIDNTSGQILTHTYTSPGLYTMNLSLTDDNDCSNNNLLDYQILVSTNPDFTGTSSNVTMCVGDEVDLTGMIQGVLYNAEPSVDFGDGLFIPDDQSQCFYSQLTFTSFNAGAVVNDANVDIQNIFMNFEHSFMGDLTITFICPNGGSILVHQQGGSGTFLGEPVDDDLDPDNPGIGYDYWWEPGATNGTWADNIQGTLPSGVYESVQPFTNLNGCPLNGTWEVEVCDLWGQDNGFIFDWSIEFAPELYPEAVSFTPTFGPECDSTWWDGPSI
ncbi:MAG TPA: PKD domain-containing protein, partial [Flavobacteriales bacterium]|nr:PKD domain-containing protein [Flavobacteriales bacterium]